MPKDDWRKANNRAKYGRAERTPEHAKKYRPKAQKGYACPKCRKGMVVRFNKASGEPFMGCERFPKCNGTARVRKPESQRPQPARAEPSTTNGEAEF